MSRRLMRSGKRGKTDRARRTFPEFPPTSAKSPRAGAEPYGTIGPEEAEKNFRQRQEEVIQEVAALDLPPTSYAPEVE